MGIDLKIFDNFNREWALLTAGNMDSFNMMTISWGGLGTLWGLPVATVYVKPIRYTHEFMEKSEYFTVSFFSEAYREDLKILGSKSGRDGNKLSLTKLTACAFGGCVGYKEAEQVLLCKKIYRQDLDLSEIPESAVRTYYLKEAPHTIYIGQVIDILNS